jgi:hypothetical protein
VERRRFQRTDGLALVRLPLVGTGLGQANVREEALDELAGHVLGALWVVVEGGDGGEDGGSGVGCELHIAQVNAIEGGLPNTQNEGPILFEANIGGAVDEVRGEAVGDRREGPHRTGEDDHRIGGVAAAGDVSADVSFGVALELGAGCANEFFCEVVAAAQLQFFGEDAEGAVGCYEVDFGDAGVGGEGAEDLGGVDAAAGSGDGEGDVAWFWHDSLSLMEPALRRA